MPVQDVNDNGKIFLGLDSSTQGLKATAIAADFRVLAEHSVNYDADLPEFKTAGGVHRDGLAVTAPPLMWLAALDLLLAHLKASGLPLKNVAAISGSGQQHGSVYMRVAARDMLRTLAPKLQLRKQLGDLFARSESPIWMDSSTTQQCRERDAALGGPQATATLTGSRSYERFTGNQIAKICDLEPGVYAATERIALVSSFMASLLIGDYAPIDASDGSGMNLMDLWSKQWSAAALDVTAPELGEKLGPIVASHATIGKIHRYYAVRYGFSPDCRIIAFSGDNPNSLAGLRLEHTGDIAISMGTSDTVFGSLAKPVPSAEEGHIFANPIVPDAYMALICYKNGSLTRERIRDERVGGSWDRFNAALGRTKPGNGGCIGFYIQEPEITPPILATGVHRFGPDDNPVENMSDDNEVRAVVEGQFLSMRLHGARIGLEPRNILATGGASSNAAILRIMADVFGVPVLTADRPNSASLGATYRALNGWKCGEADRFVSFAEVMAGAPPFTKAADPDMRAHAVYGEMLGRYEKLERLVIRRASA